MAGYLEKRGQDSWRLVVSDGYDEEGKRIKRTKTFKGTESQAKKALALFIAEVDRGEYFNPGKITLTKFIKEYWLKDAEKRLAPRTLGTHFKTLENRIIPELGNIKLSSLKVMHIKQFYDSISNRLDKREGALSQATLNRLHSVLSGVLQCAVNWELIRDNPCKKVKPVASKEYKEIVRDSEQVYDYDSLEKLFTALEHEEIMWQALVVLAVTTGARRGELVGLKWDDIDFDNKTLEIKRSMGVLKGKGVVAGPPKTAQSERTLIVPDFALVLLKQWSTRQKELRLMLANKWEGEGYVFTNFKGGVLNPERITQWWPKFINKHGLPYIPFKNLRHTSATILIDQKQNIKAVSARLGHSNIKTTLNVYAKSLKSADKESADIMDSILGKNKNQG